MHCQRVLDYGSHLTIAHPSSRDRRRGHCGVPVREVEYSLPGVEATEPVCRLVTTILHPQAAPAHELAVPCHQRWEAETACSEVKVHLRHRHRYWRGKSPVTVRQKCCGRLLAHYVVRRVRNEAAAQAGLDPDRLSFTHCLRVLRRQLPNYAMAAQRRRKLVYQRTLSELLDEVYAPRLWSRVRPPGFKSKYDSPPSSAISLPSSAYLTSPSMSMCLSEQH